MSFGLDRTFETLAGSANLAANALLVEWVFHGSTERSLAALDLVLHKRDPEALYRLVSGYDRLGEAARAKLRGLGSFLANPIRRAYLEVDDAPYRNACALIRALPDFDQAQLLLGSFAKDTARKRDGEKLLSFLVGELVRRWDTPEEERSGPDIEPIRQRMLATLREGMRRFTLHHSEVIPESFLLLADDDAPEVGRILREPHDLCHRAMAAALRRRSHPRIFRWIPLLLETRHPPPIALAVVGERDDPEFVRYLLDNISKLVEPTILLALRRVHEIRWLKPDHRIWTALTGEQQAAAVILATQCAIGIERKLELMAFLLDKGEPRARRAAACGLAHLPGADATQMIRACLDDEDPDVQLAATQQIRERGVANSLGLLLQKLEHADPRIRDAAREALSDYTFERYVGSFDSMDDSTRRAMGAAILKIDPGAKETLAAELRSGQRRARMRAAKITRVLGRADGYLDELIALLGDGDHLVRREVIETLATSPRQEIIERLGEAARRQGHNLQGGAAEAIDHLRRIAVDPDVRRRAQTKFEELGAAWR